MKSKSLVLILSLLTFINFTALADGDEVRKKNLAKASELLGFEVKGNIREIHYQYGCQWGGAEIIFDERGRISTYGSWDDGGGVHERYVYDDHCRISYADIEEHWVDEDDCDVIKKRRYHYDDKGLLVKIELFLVGTVKEYYDEKTESSKIIKKLCNPERLISCTRYIYDDYKRVISEKVENKEKNTSSNTIYRYNSNGILVGKDVINSNGEETYYVYDSHANEISHKSYESGQLTYYLETKYTYDSRGNILSQQSYNRNGQIRSSDKYTYDHRGKMISQESYSVYADEKGTEVRVYKYDSQGRLQAIITDKYSLIREYDAIGNLIRQDPKFNDESDWDPNTGCAGFYCEYVYR